MTELLDWQSAQQIILQHTPCANMETLPLEQSLYRVLAGNITANRDHPPYNISAMDGYAVRAADIATAPTTLNIIEDIEAGKRPRHTLSGGQCARIMTGAAIPEGADTIIRVEDTESTPAATDATPRQVRILVSAPSGTDIRLRGEHLRTGNPVLSAGATITPGVFGMLAMLKQAQVRVFRQPSVGILSTGDELEGLHDPFDPDKIPDANSHSLLAQLQELGIQASLLGIARDNPQALKTAIQQGLSYDVLLISGGTSVGVHDYVRPVLETLGVQMLFWRVAIRPGHPVAFGTTKSTQVFCLPGNPVSSMVCCELFVLPALRARMGHRTPFRRTLAATLTQRIKHKPGRTDFQRVTLQQHADGWLATPIVDQGSGSLLSMAQADGLAIVPAESNGLEAGDDVTVQCFHHLLWATQP